MLIHKLPSRSSSASWNWACMHMRGGEFGWGGKGVACRERRVWGREEEIMMAPDKLLRD